MNVSQRKSATHLAPHKAKPRGRQKKSVQRKKDMRRNEWDILLRTLRCAAQWVTVSNFVHKLVN